MSKASAYPPAAYDTHRQTQALEANRPGYFESLGPATKTEWVSSWIVRDMMGNDYQTDPNFVFSEYEDEFTKGIPYEYRDRFHEAVSYEHAAMIRLQTLDVLESEQKLASAGWSGLAARLTAGMLDPTVIAATIATEGAAAPWAFATKATRLQRALRTGLVGLAVDAPVEAYMASQDPSRDMSSVAFALAASFTFTGSLGGLLSPIETRQFQKAGSDLARAIEADEIAEAGLELTEKGKRYYRLASTNGDELIEADHMDVLFEGLKNASGEKGRSILGRLRFGMTGRGTQSPIEDTRRLFRMMAQDILPDAKGAPTTLSATELIDLRSRQLVADLYPPIDSSFKGWAKRTGQKASRANRRTFAEEVGRATRRPVDEIADPDVATAANKVRSVLNEYLHRGQRHGLAGFDEILDDPRYLMRIWSAKGIETLTAEVGQENVHQLIKQSLAQGAGQFTESQADAIAKALRINTIRRQFAPDQAHTPIWNNNSTDTLERILREELNLGDNYVDDILWSVTKDSKSGQAINRTKRRLDLDEATSITAVDSAGNPIRDISLDELLENDAVAIVQSYARQIDGAIAERKILEAFAEEGEAAVPSFETLLARMADKVSQMGKPNVAKKFARDAARATVLNKIITGQPLGTVSPEIAKWLSRIRQLNLLRVGGKFGLAQIPETGQLMGAAGFRAISKHVPAMRLLHKRALDGKLTNETLREIQAITGEGTDGIGVALGRHTHRFSDWGAVDAPNMSKVDDTIEAGGDWLNKWGSGMTPINERLQMMAALAATQKFVDSAFGARIPSPRRLALIGLSPQDAEGVFKQIRKYAETTKGHLGTSYRKINIDKWDDAEAAAKFVTGISKWSGRVIQRNDPGQLAAWMTSDAGRIITQFRSFTISSWEKQVLHGLYARDLQVFSEWSASMLVGSLAYISLQYTNSIGRTDRQEFLAERLSPVEIGKGAFQRAGFAAMFPSMIDSGLMMMRQPAAFSYGRTTGMAADWVSGSPSVDFLQKSINTVSGAIAATTRGDYQWSQANHRDLTSLIPFQNMAGIQNVLQAIGGTLPQRSKE